MKIKYNFLSFALVFIISLFVSNVDVNAAVNCNYTLNLSPNQPETSKYKHYEEYLDFFLYENLKGTTAESTWGGSNVYLNQFSKKFATFIRSKNLVALESVSKIPDNATFMNAAINTELSSDGVLKSTKLTFDAKYSYSVFVLGDFDGKVVDVDTTDSSYFQGYKDEYFTYTADNFNVANSRSYCPDVLILKFNFDALLKYGLIDVTNAIYYDDYTDDGNGFSDINFFDDVMYDDNRYLVAISTNPTEMKNVDKFDEYFIAKSCDLIFLDQNMNSNSVYLDQVLDLSSDLKDRGVYDELLDWTESELVEEAKKHEDDKGSWEVGNAVLNLPYFDGELSASDEFINSVSEKMSNDKTSINDYLSRLETCLENVSLEKYVKMFGDNPTVNPVDLKEYSHILDKMENKDFIKSIIIAKLEKEVIDNAVNGEDAEEGIFNDCEKIGDPKGREECKKDALQKEFSKINCENLWPEYFNKTQNVELTSYELLIKANSESNCPDGDIDCLLKKCEILKKINDEDALNLMTGNTESQKVVLDFSADLVDDIIEMHGYELHSSSAFCKVINSALGDYIVLALRLIRVIGVVLIIALTGYDVIKVVASHNDDESKKLFKGIKIRLICLVILLLVPTLTDLLLSLIEKGVCSELRGSVGLS